LQVVVIFSSSAERSDIDRAYQLGANSYIQKPVEMERFYEIAQLLKGWWLGYNHFPPVDQASPLMALHQDLGCTNP